ncbi:MAG: TIGR01777 family protein [Rickettsiaceae bacterium]|nr:TIGR01777 family protein [Rickettsiaceae bacterium]
MHILISGASGFIGTILVNNLSNNHNITVLGRKLNKLEQSFSRSINKLTFEDLPNHNAAHYDLIINLSGANIGAKRWTQSTKKELIESRTATNQKIIDWLIKQGATPRFFCASAIGIYGAQDISTESFDEYSVLPLTTEDFLQNICFAWEESLQKAIDASISVTKLRFGVVLKKGSGMLQKLELPFRLGLGSVLGSGQQMLSWIDYEDLVRAVNFLIEHPNITGPVNITSPAPVIQKEFAQEFSNVLGRHLFFKTPAWLIKLLFGEMGEYLLLKGQKVLPTRLTELGFQFSYSRIMQSLFKEYSAHNNIE